MAHPIAHNGITKVCCSCKQEKKLLLDFSRRSDRGGSYQSKCKACAKEAQAVWYQEHKEDEIARAAEYQRTTPGAYEKKLACDRRRLQSPAGKEMAKANMVRYLERHRGTDAYKRQQHKRQHTRRARKLNQFIEDIDRNVVYEMHGGMCGICEEFIDKHSEEAREYIAKGKSWFHVDHVIPLAKKGLHGYVNVQPAHPKCNTRKGVRI